MAQQLALALELQVELNFANYHPGANTALITQLQQALTQNGERFFYIWGAAGCGKTHLLQACCQAVEATRTVSYIPLRQMRAYTPAVLNELEYFDLVCIDDIDAVRGQTVWEEALFHLYNRLRAAQGMLIVSGGQAINRLNLTLPDLSSRLSWGLVYAVHDSSDADKVHIICRRAEHLGLHLPSSVAQYMLTHYSRNLNDVQIMLKKLDKASLCTQRRLTIPFVKLVLSPC